MLWVDEHGTPRVAPATLEDQSQNGLSVRTKEPVGDGSHVTVRWGSEQFSGTVTNCRLQKSHFVVGVKREAGE